MAFAMRYRQMPFPLTAQYDLRLIVAPTAVLHLR